MPEGDPALGEIVRRKFHGDAIARQDADAIAPETARQMRQHDPFMFQLHAKQPAGKFF